MTVESQTRAYKGEDSQLRGISAMNVGKQRRKPNPQAVFSYHRMVTERNPVGDRDRGSRPAARDIKAPLCIPRDGTLRVVILRRAAEVRRVGIATTSANPLKYLTTDPSGPMLRPASARVSRGNLESAGFLYVQKRAAILFERSDP